MYWFFADSINCSDTGEKMVGTTMSSIVLKFLLEHDCIFN